jgi:hypothetical protein
VVEFVSIPCLVPHLPYAPYHSQPEKNPFVVKMSNANIFLQAVTALSKPQNSVIWAPNSTVPGTPAAQLTAQNYLCVVTGSLKQVKNAILKMRTEYRAQAVMLIAASAAPGIANRLPFAAMVSLRVAKR